MSSSRQATVSSTEQQNRVDDDLKKLLKAFEPMHCQPAAEYRQQMPLESLRQHALTAFLQAGHLSASNSLGSYGSGSEASSFDGMVLSPVALDHSHMAQSDNNGSTRHVGLPSTKPNYRQRAAATYNSKYAHRRPIKNCLCKTELCRTWEATGRCSYGSRCQFAHGIQDLKNVQHHPKFKTEVCCSYMQTGDCPYGARCRFIHPEDVLPHQANVSMCFSPVQALQPRGMPEAQQPPAAAVSNGNAEGHTNPAELPCCTSIPAAQHIHSKQATSPPAIPGNSQKAACAFPALSMLPQYTTAPTMLPQHTTSPVPVPCQTFISQLWSAEGKLHPDDSNQEHNTAIHPAMAEPAKGSCIHQPHSMYKYNIWAAPDPLADIRISSRHLAYKSLNL